MKSALNIKPVKSIKGTLTIPGDKSISHRAAIFGALAHGSTCISNFLNAGDCLSTLDCLRQLDVEIEGPAGDSNDIVVHGAGFHGIKEPADVLYAGNSGTTIRLMTGLLASFPLYAVITGDHSLRERPMDRIIKPLTKMGACISGRMENTYPPLSIKGNGRLSGLCYKSPVASAQVKSAILLAGLQANGETSVEEPLLSRDHTERMLEHFGVEVTRSNRGVAVKGPAVLSRRNFTVPGDISSAAFFMVAASIIPGSDVCIRGVGVNPTRTGVIEVLQKMGAGIILQNEREECGEPVADIRVHCASLKGVSLGSDIVPRIIDEIPVLAVAAAMARGKTEIYGIEELKYKETNRVEAIIMQMHNIGVNVEEIEGGIRINSTESIAGGKCCSCGDHRMAMAMAVAGMAARHETVIEEPDCIGISFPGFYDVLKSIAVE